MLVELQFEEKLQATCREASRKGREMLLDLQACQKDLGNRLKETLDQSLQSQANFREEHRKLVVTVQALVGTLMPEMVDPFWGPCQGAWPPVPGLPKHVAHAGPGPGPARPATFAEAAAFLVPISQEPISFTVTLRKADDAGLGLQISREDSEDGLTVEGIVPGGAVEAWNRQCVGDFATGSIGMFSAGGPGPQRAVLVGDRITSVNGITRDAPKMAEECANQRLLRITVSRGGASSVMPAARLGKLAPSSCATSLAGPWGSMRTGAPEFVPAGMWHEEKEKADEKEAVGAEEGREGMLVPTGLLDESEAAIIAGGA